MVTDGTKVGRQAKLRVSKFGKTVVKSGSGRFSGYEPAHFFPKFSGSLSRLLFENGGEIRFIAVSKLKTNLRNSFVGSGEQIFGKPEMAFEAAFSNSTRSAVLDRHIAPCGFNTKLYDFADKYKFQTKSYSEIPESGYYVRSYQQR